MCYGLWLNEKSGKKGFETLKSTRIENCPAKRSVFRWFKEFEDGNFQFEHKPRSGRPVSVTTGSNVQIVKESFSKDRKLTYKRLSKSTKITKSSIRNIVIGKLKASKFRPIMNPHKLTVELMRERKEWCIKMLQKFEKNPHELDKVVTGDETYLFYEQEREGKVWTFPGEDYPRATKKTRFTSRKRM